MYKLVIFDLDGTLLNPQRAIQKESLDAIEKLRKKGIKVALATGRHHTSALAYYKELDLDTPMICCNGSYIYDPQNDEFLQVSALNGKEVRPILKMLKTTKVESLLYTQRAMTYESLSNGIMDRLQKGGSSKFKPVFEKVNSLEEFIKDGDLIWKMVTLNEDRDYLENLLKDLDPKEFNTEWSWIDQLDIMKAGTTKGKMLLNLLKDLGIDSSEVIAFGDNHNDISMLKEAGLGIAMGNSSPIVKENANKVIGNNDTQAIAQCLNKIFNL
ncbi:MAG: Cof-type HAD-IIB family hydrolase [Psittacicella sp.]